MRERRNSRLSGPAKEPTETLGSQRNHVTMVEPHRERGGTDREKATGVIRWLRFLHQLANGGDASDYRLRHMVRRVSWEAIASIP